MTEAGRLRRTSPSASTSAPQRTKLVLEPARRRHGERHRNLRRHRPLPRHRHEHLLDAAEETAARDVHDALGLAMERSCVPSGARHLSS